MKFSVHVHPVWRDRANFIIQAKLPEEGRYEQLWTRKLGDTQFEVCCIPFFLYGVALGDVVETSLDVGSEYLLAKVKESRGRYVFRVFFASHQYANRESVVAELAGVGALLEWSSHSLLAVDAENHVIAQRIADELAHRANRGELVYESGRS